MRGPQRDASRARAALARGDKVALVGVQARDLQLGAGAAPFYLQPRRALYAYPRFCEMPVRNGRGEWLHD